MTENDHFKLEEWAEFVRGQVRPEDRARMERHLQEGCSDCAQTLELWKGVLDAASREAAFEPPDNVLRCAKALYSAFPPDKTSGLNLRVARLSRIGQQALGGVRASPGLAGTHLLFREGTVLLDMCVRPVRASESVSLMGQVVDSAQLNVRLEDRQVSVVRASSSLAQTSTNEFGEFHLEFEPGEDLLLVVELKNQSYLVSHLPVPKR
jgi:anti-sigma factor RsiW